MNFSKKLLSLTLPLGLISLTAQAQTTSIPGATAPTPAVAKERVKYVLILPEEKTKELVKPTEHCPFTKELKPLKDENEDSEHNLVQNTLLALKATGVTRGPDGWTVLLGSLRLKAGMRVPPIIPNQTVQVIVNSVTPEAIDFRWEDEKLLKRGLTASTFTSKLNLQDRVRVILTGANRPDPDGRKTSRVTVAELPPALFVTPVPENKEAMPEGEAPPKATIVQDSPPPAATQGRMVMKNKTEKAEPPAPTKPAAQTQPATTGKPPATTGAKPSEANQAASRVLDLFFKQTEKTP
jgi:hypothetical protein